MSFKRSFFKSTVLFSLCVGMLVAPASIFAGDEKTEQKQVEKTATTQESAPVNKMCPVAGDEIDPSVTTTYEGKTIAFCCKSCIAKFKKDPAKYMKDLK